MHFLGGFEKQYFQDGKKTIFLVTKSGCLGEKKGVQFAWAKWEDRSVLGLVPFSDVGGPRGSGERGP